MYRSSVHTYREVRSPFDASVSPGKFGAAYFTVYVIFRRRGYFFRTLSYPNIIFCLVFSVTFAFAIGVSTFNFGTLTQYKIPLLPFYFVALTLMMHYSNKDRNDEAVEATE